MARKKYKLLTYEDRKKLEQLLRNADSRLEAAYEKERRKDDNR